MSFDAGSIVGKLELDGSGFSSAIAHATGEATSFAGPVIGGVSLALVGLAGVAAAAGYAVHAAFEDMKETFLGTAHAMDNLGESAQKLGVEADFLNTMGAVASDAGSSVEGLGESLKFLNKNAADAAAGQKDAVDAFAEIGVAATDVYGKLRPTQELFYDVADALEHMTNPAERTSTAMKLLGRGGNDMIAVLTQGSVKLREMQADIGALEGTITDDLLEAGDRFGTLETLATSAWTGIKRAFSEPILLYVGGQFDEIKRGIFDVTEAIKTKLAGVRWSDLFAEASALFARTAEKLKSLDWESIVKGLLKVLGAMIRVGELALDLTEKFEKLGEKIKEAFDGLKALDRTGTNSTTVPGTNEPVPAGWSDFAGIPIGGVPSQPKAKLDLTISIKDSAPQIAGHIKAAVDKRHSIFEYEMDSKAYAEQLKGGLDASGE